VWSAVLLGDRVGALDYLKWVALAGVRCQARVRQLTLQALHIQFRMIFLDGCICLSKAQRLCRYVSRPPKFFM
jgi:hypothetical protein